MNTDNTNFDRLADDELSEEERRELLGRLDDEPGGWRRVALAFLESQCWKQSLGEIAQSGRSRGHAAARGQAAAVAVDRPAEHLGRHGREFSWRVAGRNGGPAHVARPSRRRVTPNGINDVATVDTVGNRQIQMSPMIPNLPNENLLANAATRQPVRRT